jgi:hypothetical protein
MNQQDAKKLPHGLYRIYWKQGGSSLASMGSCYNGDRWFAPCNWTHSDLTYPKVASTNIVRMIEKAELIVAATNYGDEPGDSM